MPGVPVPMKIFLMPIEIIGMLVKPISLMIRLFANITAGHIIILALMSLIYYLSNILTPAPFWQNQEAFSKIFAFIPRIGIASFFAYLVGAFLNSIVMSVMKKRMKVALIGGALLGLICVAGAYIRSDYTASPGFVFSLWYNRVIIGLAVGAPWIKTVRSKALLRGALLGLLVSFAFYSSTGFHDHVSFVAGIVYGVILEFWLSRPEKLQK